MASFARAERRALGETALSLGPDAPTLCSGWTVKDLLVHLLVRERRPWAAPGIFVKPLEPLLHKAEEGYATQPLPALVERFLDPRPTIAALGPVDRLLNTIELFVHHEDLRRAQPEWSPRTLSAAESAELMGALRLLGRGLVRPAGVPVVVSDGTTTLTLRGGQRPVRVTGPASEIVLFCFGRSAVEGLELDGPDAHVTALKAATLGF